MRARTPRRQFSTFSLDFLTSRRGVICSVRLQPGAVASAMFTSPKPPEKKSVRWIWNPPRAPPALANHDLAPSPTLPRVQETPSHQNRTLKTLEGNLRLVLPPVKQALGKGDKENWRLLNAAQRQLQSAILDPETKAQNNALLSQPQSCPPTTGGSR